jgi:anti-sigma-K factor RskA
MTFPRLTAFILPATRFDKQASEAAAHSGWRRRTATAMLMTTAMGLSGCISVNAPDKPIVIELNINIKQEVIYRLAEDVKQNIEANPDIF